MKRRIEVNEYKTLNTDDFREIIYLFEVEYDAFKAADIMTKTLKKSYLGDSKRYKYKTNEQCFKYMEETLGVNSKLRVSRNIIGTIPAIAKILKNHGFNYTPEQIEDLNVHYIDHARTRPRDFNNNQGIINIFVEISNSKGMVADFRFEILKNDATNNYYLNLTFYDIWEQNK